MKNSFWIANLFLAIVKPLPILLLAVIMLIIGLFGVDICLKIGFGVLVIYLIVSMFSYITMQRRLSYRSDDPEFNDMMDKLSADPKAFLGDIINTENLNKSLHGEELLSLSDSELYEAVYFQNLDIAEGAEDCENEIDSFEGARRIVYVLSTYDSEIQNGGLCQFFVNSSSEVAPFVADCLKVVSANEHERLYSEFLTQNSINVFDLSSFKTNSVKGFIKQTKRFDFDSFDNAYCNLPPIQDKVVEYIRANISEF